MSGKCVSSHKLHRMCVAVLEHSLAVNNMTFLSWGSACEHNEAHGRKGNRVQEQRESRQCSHLTLRHCPAINQASIPQMLRHEIKGFVIKPAGEQSSPELVHCRTSKGLQFLGPQNLF